MQQDQGRTQAGQARTAKAPGQAQGHQHEEHAERQVVDPGGKALGRRIDGAQPTQGVVDMAITGIGQGGQAYTYRQLDGNHQTHAQQNPVDPVQGGHPRHHGSRFPFLEVRSC